MSKTIFITGTSTGFGKLTALTLANAGHSVIAGMRNTNDKNAAAAKELGAVENIEVVDIDVTDDASVNKAIEKVITKYGKIDVLINNAGALINKSFTQLLETDFVEMLQSNFIGHVRIIQSLYKLMPKDAHIVNIGSMGGFQGSAKFPGLAAYSASKAALHNLTECLAQELNELGIKVNCLALGSAQTEMLEKAFPGHESPVMAFEMGKYIADFAITGHKFFNGKILPVSSSTP